jgi:hypothetical protein
MKILTSGVLSPFMGNFFCLIPNSNAAFVVISKNACTFLKKTAIYSVMGEWVDSFDSAHDIVGYSSKSRYLIPISEMKNYEKKHGKILKFAVWRDPVERIVSTYKLFCIERESRMYFQYLGINEPVSFDRFMEFLNFEWCKQDSILQDEHIRRQVDYYKPKDVDHIVSIENLNQFLKENNIYFRQEHSNKTESAFRITNDKYIESIKKRYKNDYQIRLK